MSKLEKDACLGDSSGSDGSLSKDLPQKAEMNFATHGVNLAFEDGYGGGSAMQEKRVDAIVDRRLENNCQQKDSEVRLEYFYIWLFNGLLFYSLKRCYKNSWPLYHVTARFQIKPFSSSAFVNV